MKRDIYFKLSEVNDQLNKFSQYYAEGSIISSLSCLIEAEKELKKLHVMVLREKEE